MPGLFALWQEQSVGVARQPFVDSLLQILQLIFAGVLEFAQFASGSLDVVFNGLNAL